MAHKQLKKFVGRTLDSSGKWHRADKLVIFIETTGDLWMFMELPDFVMPFLGEDAAGEAIHTDTGWIIRGRDPDKIVQKYEALLNRYIDKLRNTEAKPFIVVSFVRKTGNHKSDNWDTFYQGDYDTGFALSMHRDMRTANEVFHWPNEEGGRLRSVGRINGRREAKDVVLPYTEELWKALHDMEESMRAGIHRFADLLASKDFSQKLLASSNKNLLGFNR